MSQQDGRISSPEATGGAGTFFEQHVNATFLALLLVRGIPPILTDCQLEEVHFQTEHLGWKTDDVLLAGLNGAGERRLLAGQMKKSFTVTSKDEDCQKTLLISGGISRTTHISTAIGIGSRSLRCEAQKRFSGG